MAKILVIDDEPLVRLAVCRILELAGHEAREAANGREGLALAASWGPDVVITDILMPDMEGIETLSAIRKLAPNLPVIVMSGAGSAATLTYLKAAQRLGATHTLAKPFGVVELRRLVHLALSPPALEPGTG